MRPGLPAAKKNKKLRNMQLHYCTKCTYLLNFAIFLLHHELYLVVNNVFTTRYLNTVFTVLSTTEQINNIYLTLYM